MRCPKETLARWGYRRDPFADDPEGPNEMFWSAEHRRLREFLVDSIGHNDAVAVAADIGWGKTKLWMAIEDDLRRNGRINYFIARLRTKDIGHVTANIILLAILRAVKQQPPKSYDPEQLAWLVEDSLIARSETKKRVVLVIDEAHRLPPPALRTIKNVHEMEVTFRRLLSVVLIGQRELAPLLDSPSVREVRSRIQLVEPEPLSVADGEVRSFIRHCVCIALRERAPIGVSEDVPLPFTEDGLAAVEAIFDERVRGAGRGTLLAVKNLCSNALFSAARLGVERIDAGIVHEVRAESEGV